MSLRRSCIALSLCFAFAATASASSAQKSPFLSESDCFGGASDYAGWLKTLPAERMGQPLSAELMAKFVPQKAFEFVQASMECRLVSYDSGGVTVQGYVVAPKGGAGEKRPLLVYNRGGNQLFGATDSIALFREVFPLVKAGYVVVASNYRGGSEGKPEQVGRDEFGGRDVDDVQRLLDVSRSLPGVDADNVFVFGVSRGAMMSYLLAKKNPEIRAMATIGGPTDLAAGLKWRPEMERVYQELIPGYAKDKQAALDSRSALRWADQLPAGLPVLMLHGEADDRVSVEDSRAMEARLKALNREHKLVVYPGDDHGIRTNRREAYGEIFAWFESHRKAAGP